LRTAAAPAVALMDENGEPNDDVVTVYQLHLEDVEE
jgi:hypothetical protein